MLAQRIRSWPATETALGDCPLFGRIAMRLTLSSSHRPKSHYPDNATHWPNADVILGQRL